MKTIRTSVTTLNLEFLITDILKKQKNPTSITSKRTYVYRANRTPKDPTYQNKSLKHTENFRPSNRRRRPDKSSSHNILSEDNNDKTSKNVEIKLESDLNLKLESFTYIIKNFDLNDSKSSCSTSSLNFDNNIKNSKTKKNYLTTFNKSKKSLKQSLNRLDLLLYDINTTDHIVNDKK